MKISANWTKKEEREWAVGVRTGSMKNHVRRKNGIDVEKNVGRVLCRRVIGRSWGGQDRDGRDFKEGRRVRGGELVGVRISLLLLENG
jgi:hypothetical protein